ncbi:hypothetical protein THIOKS1850012 [Thiocapsa sp. KS1]|nr:hypothetical protein THIOKS1850012 [Thiocapsa sp. KS1]
MDWITDQIAIGNFGDAVTLPSDVDALLCMKSDCCDEGKEDVEVLCVPLVDGPGNDLRDVRGRHLGSSPTSWLRVGESWSTATRGGRAGSPWSPAS